MSARCEAIHQTTIENDVKYSNVIYIVVMSVEEACTCNANFRDLNNLKLM